MDVHYEQLRQALAELQGEFDRGAVHWSGLFHDLLVPDEKQECWDGFISANRDGDVWEPHPDGRGCSRFYGTLSGLQHFQRLGARGYVVLATLNVLAQSDSSLPRAFRLNLPGYDGHLGWLDAVHEAAAFFRTVLLDTDSGLWKYDGDYKPGDWEDRIQRVTKPSDGGKPYYTHPMRVSLLLDVFISSREAIRLWLEPESAYSVDAPLSDLSICLPAVDSRFDSSLPLEAPLVDDLSVTADEKEEDVAVETGSDVPVQRGKLWHTEGDRPPEQFQFGPLEGSQVDLARWMGLKEPRPLSNKVKNRVIFIQRVDRIHWKVWFVNERDWSLASDKQRQERGNDES